MEISALGNDIWDKLSHGETLSKAEEASTPFQKLLAFGL